jgi:ankyrin repeat protein
MDELDFIIFERSTYWHDEWSKLHHACQLGLTGCIGSILETGADINAQDSSKFTPLYIACTDLRTMDCAKLLIAAGADVNIPNNQGETPLHAACTAGGPTECIELLIAAGADVNAQTEDGATPLHCACHRNKTHLVQALLEAGADPTIEDIYENLPQYVTDKKEIRELINNFGLGGGRATKAAP